MEKEKISKNFYLSDKIETAEQLHKAAKEGKSVWVTVWRRHSPAAFILSMQFRLVMDWIEKERFYKVQKIKNNE